jgi:hypothetical protein
MSQALLIDPACVFGELEQRTLHDVGTNHRRGLGVRLELEALREPAGSEAD